MMPPASLPCPMPHLNSTADGRGAAITRRERRCADVLSNQELLISGDRDLLALAGKPDFSSQRPRPIASGYSAHRTLSPRESLKAKANVVQSCQN
jgi:hypothetical protein